MTNTNISDNNIYDMMVMQQYPSVTTVQVGHTILMDDNNYPMAYTGLNDNTNRKPVSFLVHVIFYYEQRVRQLLNMDESCYPIPVGQWPTGHTCSYDDECGSGSMCLQKQCSDVLLSSGQLCQEDRQCQSGSCATGGRFSWRKRCQ